MEAIDKLHSTGLIVRALVCDQHTTNISALKLLGFSKTTPYISHPTAQAKVYIIFDPPHLIKNLRNNLIRYDITTNGKTVSWKYLHSLYNIDKQNPVRLAPKLTESHLEPGPLLSMRVKLATQVFSHQVSAAMSLYIIAKLLPSDALATCEFFKKIDTLFDMMNSRKLFADKPARCALTEGETIKYLEEIRN